MRATVTRLMSKGISSRGMPVSGDVTFSTDGAGRKLLALNSIEKSEIPVIATLLHPQMASMAWMGTDTEERLGPSRIRIGLPEMTRVDRS